MAVVEIAAQMGVSEKRMHAIVRDILDRRMPHPPKEFVAIQASRLNEALLVAYSAMSMTNLGAVDRVVKIVRELDRYHGLSAVAGRRRFEPDELAAPDEGTVAYGGAFVCRAEWAAADDEDLVLEYGTQDPLALPESSLWNKAARSPAADERPENPPQRLEKIDSAPGQIAPGPAAQDPLALPGLLTPGPRGDGRANLRPADGQTGEGPARHARPEISPQPLEIVESAPGILESPGDADAARGETRVSAPTEPGPPAPPAAAPADVRPENPPQRFEKIDSAPGNGERSDAAPAAPPEFPVIRMPILTSTGLKFVNARRTPNGMVAC